MEYRTWALKRKAEAKRECFWSAIKKARQAIEFSGGGEIVLQNFLNIENSSPGTQKLRKN